MNKWLRRTTGSVIVAAAVLLLGAGTAPAHGPGIGGGGNTLNLEPQVPESLRASVDGPNMIGDDFIDQSPYADGSPSAAAPVTAETVGLPVTADGFGRWPQERR